MSINQTQTDLEVMIYGIIAKQNIANDLLRCSRIDGISNATKEFLLDKMQDMNRLIISMTKALAEYVDKNCPKNIQDMTKKINEEVKSTLEACNLKDLDDGAFDDGVGPSHETNEKWNILMSKIAKNDTKDIKLDGSSNPMTPVTKSDIEDIANLNDDTELDAYLEAVEKEKNSKKKGKAPKQQKSRKTPKEKKQKAD